MAKKQAQNFERQMLRLQEIVQELERADLALEKNVALYKEGRELARSCKELLDRARHEITLCGENGLDAHGASGTYAAPFAPGRENEE